MTITTIDERADVAAPQSLRPDNSRNGDTPAKQAAFRAPPELLTQDDLFLRRWQLSDAEALNAAACSASSLARWMPWAADGYDLAKAQQFLAFSTAAWTTGEEYDYAIIVDGRVSGSLGIMAPVSNAPNTLEIGYWLADAATGRGLATRAAAVLAQTAFAIGAEHVQIRHDELNHRSGAIPRKLGFTCLGIHHLPDGKGGEVVRSVLWQKDRDEGIP